MPTRGHHRKDTTRLRLSCPTPGPFSGSQSLPPGRNYESLKETAFLLRNPENARRLLTAIERLESGGGTARDLIE